MMRKVSLIASTSLLVLPLFLGNAFSADKVSLEGKRYEVDLTEAGKAGKDTLIFTKRHLESTQCRQYGFKPSRYRVTGTADSIAFVSDAKSKAEGLNMWSGYVKGNAITATMVWKKKGQEDKVYTGAGMEISGPQAGAKRE